MTKGDLAKLRFLGRPVKPVAFGLTFLMLCLTFINLSNVGALGDSLLGDVIAIMAGMGAIVLALGWWLKHQHIAEAGLLIAGFVYMARSAFIGLNDITIGFYLGLGVAIIAFGSYLLEATDDRKDA